VTRQLRLPLKTPISKPKTPPHFTNNLIFDASWFSVLLFASWPRPFFPAPVDTPSSFANNAILIIFPRLISRARHCLFFMICISLATPGDGCVLMSDDSRDPFFLFHTTSNSSFESVATGTESDSSFFLDSDMTMTDASVIGRVLFYSIPPPVQKQRSQNPLLESPSFSPFPLCGSTFSPPRAAPHSRRPPLRSPSFLFERPLPKLFRPIQVCFFSSFALLAFFSRGVQTESSPPTL